MPHPGQVHAGVVHLGQAQPRAGLEAALQAAQARGLVGRRDAGLDQVHGRVHQHARGAPGRVAQDAPAGRVGGALVDAGQGQRPRVDPGGVAVDALEEGRVLADVEVGGRGEAPLGPVVLVPAPAQQPGPGGQLRGRTAGALAGLGQAGDARQVELLEARAQPLDVQVRVGQARQHGGSAQSQAPRAWPRQGLDGGVAADRQHAPLAHGHGRGGRGRDGLVERHDVASGQDQVGGGGQGEQHVQAPGEHCSLKGPTGASGRSGAASARAPPAPRRARPAGAAPRRRAA